MIRVSTPDQREIVNDGVALTDRGTYHLIVAELALAQTPSQGVFDVPVVICFEAAYPSAMMLCFD